MYAYDLKGDHYPQVFFPLGVFGSLLEIEYRLKESIPDLTTHAISNAFFISSGEQLDRGLTLSSLTLLIHVPGVVRLS